MNKRLLNQIKTALADEKNIVFAYLFGSMVKNKSRYGSDLDIAVYFRTLPDLNEIGKLNLMLEETLSYKIDLIQLNNLDKQNPVLAYSVISDGILLMNENTTLLNEYIKSVLLQYLDFKPTSEFINKSFSSRLLNNRFAVFEK